MEELLSTLLDLPTYAYFMAQYFLCENIGEF